MEVDHAHGPAERRSGVVVSAIPSAAHTFLVPQDWATIQLAIDRTAAGDTVLVGPGTYT